MKSDDVDSLSVAPQCLSVFRPFILQLQEAISNNGAEERAPSVTDGVIVIPSRNVIQ